MSTYLITGGAGFVGSHLAEALLDQGHHVIILDDLSSGSMGNVEHLRTHGALEFIVGGLKSFSLLEELVDRSDVIYHLAASVGVFNIIESPVRTVENNIGGTQSVLRAASVRKRKVIVASTSEVYGKSVDSPFREDGDLVLGPSSKARWSYAASKLVDEFLALAYWREHQVPTVVVRLFNTIGPRQTGQYGMVVPRFITQALRGQNLTVFGNGQQTRCFTCVYDVVEWLQRLASEKAAIARVFNLGNPREISIEELARLVIRLTGAQVGIDYIPYEKAYDPGFEDMERRVPDISRVVETTGYRPRYSLEETLGVTIDSIRAQQTWPPVP